MKVSPICAKMFHEEERFEYAAIGSIGFRKMQVDKSVLHIAFNAKAFSFALPHNYYPNTAILIETLNKLVMEKINNMPKEYLGEDEIITVFHVNVHGYCAFTPVPHFKVDIFPFLLNLLKLCNTMESNVASNTPDVLPSAARDKLFVHCSAVNPHLVNNDEMQLLRIINNTAEKDVAAMVSFPYLQYYPVSNRYFKSIRTYITDNFTTDPLIFENSVSYLLHFRPCHPSL